MPDSVSLPIDSADGSLYWYYNGADYVESVEEYENWGLGGGYVYQQINKSNGYVSYLLDTSNINGCDTFDYWGASVRIGRTNNQTYGDVNIELYINKVVGGWTLAGSTYSFDPDNFAADDTYYNKFASSNVSGSFDQDDIDNGVRLKISCDSTPSLGGIRVDFINVTCNYTQKAPPQPSQTAVSSDDDPTCYAGYHTLTYNVPDDESGEAPITYWELQYQYNATTGSWSSLKSGSTNPLTNQTINHGSESSALDVDIIYYYRLYVESMDENGVGSTPIAITMSAPNTPTLYTSVHHTSEEYTPTWTAVTGADKYGLYRTTAGDGFDADNDVIISQCNETGYAHTAENGMWDYRVIAKGNLLDEDYWSDPDLDEDVDISILPEGPYLHPINPAVSYDASIYMDWEPDDYADYGYSIFWTTTYGATGSAIVIEEFENNTEFSVSVSAVGNAFSVTSASNYEFPDGYGYDATTPACIIITDSANSGIIGYPIPIVTSAANHITIDSKYDVNSGGLYELVTSDTFTIGNASTHSTYYTDTIDTTARGVSDGDYVYYKIFSHGEYPEGDLVTPFSVERSVEIGNLIQRWNYYGGATVNSFNGRNIILDRVISNYKYMEAPTCDFRYMNKQYHFKPNSYVRINTGYGEEDPSTIGVFEGYVDEVDASNYPRSVKLRSIINSDLNTNVLKNYSDKLRIEMYENIINDYCDILTFRPTEHIVTTLTVANNTTNANTIYVDEALVASSYSCYALYSASTGSYTERSYMTITDNDTTSITVTSEFDPTGLEDDDEIWIVDVPTTIASTYFENIPVVDCLKYFDREETRITYWTPELVSTFAHSDKQAEKQKVYWSANGDDSGVSVTQDDGIEGNSNVVRLPWKISKVILLGGYINGGQISTTVSVTDVEQNYGTIKDTYTTITDETELAVLAQTILDTHNKAFLQITPDIHSKGVIFPGQTFEAEWFNSDAAADTWLIGDEMSVGEDLTTTGVTTVYMDVTPSALTPSSGDLHLEGDDGETYIPVSYSAWSGTAFTITSTDFGNDEYSASRVSVGNKAYAEYPRDYIMFSMSYDLQRDLLSTSALDSMYYPASDQQDLPEQNRQALGTHETRINALEEGDVEYGYLCVGVNRGHTGSTDPLVFKVDTSGTDYFGYTMILPGDCDTTYPMEFTMAITIQYSGTQDHTFDVTGYYSVDGSPQSTLSVTSSVTGNYTDNDLMIQSVTIDDSDDNPGLVAGGYIYLAFYQNHSSDRGQAKSGLLKYKKV